MKKAKQISSEFERQVVPENKLKSWKSFLGMYAGEHAAGTEFMIGPLFLTVGISAFDLLAGLLLGNLLAVFSWRYLTANIAVQQRLTLYFKLEKISIDLHGMRYGQARIAIENHITNCINSNYSHVRIVHGHGTGTLRRLTKELFNESEFIEEFYLEQNFIATIGKLKY